MQREFIAALMSLISQLSNEVYGLTEKVNYRPPPLEKVVVMRVAPTKPAMILNWM